MSKRFVLALLALPLLASCGLKGDLERPAPIFGEARERYEAEQAQRAADAAARGETAEEAKPAKTVPTPPPPDRPIQSSPIAAPGLDQ